MPSGNTPSVRLRRIGSALRKAREECGMTLDTACRRYLALRPPGRLTVTVVEDLTQSTFVENETEVATFERIFSYFRNAALDDSSSLRFLEEIASQTSEPRI